MPPVLLLITPESDFRARVKKQLPPNFSIVEKATFFDTLQWIEQGNIPGIVICTAQLHNIYGPDLVKMLRLYFPVDFVPVVMITADPNFSERSEAMRSGTTVYLPLAPGHEQLAPILKALYQQRVNTAPDTSGPEK